jgi:hypothetical protein
MTAASADPVSSTEVEQFILQGMVRIRKAFAVATAVRLQEALWRRLAAHGILPGDRSTWQRPFSGIGSTGDYQEAADGRLHRVYDQLIGAGCWQMPTSWGQTRVTFPQLSTAWHLTSDAWHSDYWPSDTSPAGLLVIACLSELRPSGGGTLMVAGSHRALARYAAGLTEEQRRWKNGRKSRGFAEYTPWLSELTEGRPCVGRRTDRFMHQEHITEHGERLRVVELVGEPGDVWLCHPYIYHAASMNTLEVPRMMRFGLLHLSDPRATGVGGTPLTHSVAVRPASQPAAAAGS